MLEFSNDSLASRQLLLLEQKSVGSDLIINIFAFTSPSQPDPCQRTRSHFRLSTSSQHGHHVSSFQTNL